MKLVAPETGIFDWLKEMQAQGVERDIKIDGEWTKVQTPLIDPRNRNIFQDPQREGSGS